MQDINDAIATAVRSFSDAFTRQDPVAIAAMYTTDATLLPPDSEMMRGRDAIQNFWQGAMNMGIKEASLETVSVESRDDLAYEVGKFRMSMEVDAASMTGKYVVVWKVEGDAWRMHVDIWNGDPQA